MKNYNGSVITLPSASSRLNAELISDGSVTNAESNYSDGLSGKMQDQLNLKVFTDVVTWDVAIVGKVTTGVTAGVFHGINTYHSLIFKGYSTAFGPTYAITTGDVTSFVETGGIWRFR